MKPGRVVIITGLSGSGKSTAARALEDEGFFVVDNLPVILLPQLLGLSREGGSGSGDVVIVLDVRNQGFLADGDTTLAAVRDAGYRVDILFFEASDEILVRRFSETRRRHPLARQEGVREGIRRERDLLSGLRHQATAITETSQLTPHQLRTQVVELVRGKENPSPLIVVLQSFGFRYGIPTDSDLVMDVRFLPNPFFIQELRGRDGLDPLVQKFVLDQPACREFLVRFEELLKFLLPHYRTEGKSYLTLSIGCTGGRHRSVAVTESLGSTVGGAGITLKVAHRDIDKG